MHWCSYFHFHDNARFTPRAKLLISSVKNSCDISNVSQCTFMMETKVIFGSSLSGSQTPPVTSIFSFLSVLDSHFFFFYSITTAFSQASLPLGLSELDYHGLCHCYSQLLSITHSLRASEMCTLFDPLILFLRTHHSRTFLCHSFFHLFI